MDSGLQTVMAMLGLMAASGIIAAIFSRSEIQPAPAPAVEPAPDNSPLVWTEAGLIDFFQLNDDMTAEQLAKFRAIIAAVEPAPAAVEPAPARIKPKLKASVESVRLASRLAPAAPAVEPAPIVEPIRELRNLAAELLDSPAPAPKARKASRYDYWEHTGLLVSIALILIIGLSNTVAGFCFRAAIGLIPAKCGWISYETYVSFAQSYAFTLINY